MKPSSKVQIDVNSVSVGPMAAGVLQARFASGSFAHRYLGPLLLKSGMEAWSLGEGEQIILMLQRFPAKDLCWLPIPMLDTYLTFPAMGNCLAQNPPSALSWVSRSFDHTFAVSLDHGPQSLFAA